MSGRRPVSAERRARIERAVRELDFVPRASARALRSSRTGVLALVVPFRSGASDRVRSRFIMEVAAAAAARHYDVLLITATAGMAEIRRVVRNGMVDGLIVMDVDESDRSPRLLAELGRPVVLMGHPNDPCGLPSVDLDTFAAGALAARWLRSLGHERIALLGGRAELYDQGVAYLCNSRAGFAAALEGTGVEAAFHPVGSGLAGARRVVRRIASGPERCSAVAIHNDDALVALTHALGALDESPVAVAICPEHVVHESGIPLACIPVPVEALSKRCVELLMAGIAGEAAETVLFPPRLVTPDGSEVDLGSLPGSPPERSEALEHGALSVAALGRSLHRSPARAAPPARRPGSGRQPRC